MTKILWIAKQCYECDTSIKIHRKYLSFNKRMFSFVKEVHISDIQNNVF